MPNDDATTNAFLSSLKPEDVQSVSSAGVSISLRDPNETELKKVDAERKKWELERDKRRGFFNPLFCGNFHDHNQRRH